MDLSTIVAVVVILLAVGGAVAAVALDVGGSRTAPVRDRARSWLGPRPGGGAPRRPPATLSPGEGRTVETAPAPGRRADERAVSARLAAAAERTTEAAPEPAPSDPRTEGERLRDALRLELRQGLTAAGAAGEERAARLERRVEEAAERLGRSVEAGVERVERSAAEARREAEARQAAIEARFAAEDGRREAERERLRADLGALLAEWSRAPAPGADRLAERRAEAIAELYARLARLEAALAAVTNPMLLPGEPYAPPAELPADALVWENWKDVGERVFAFAEHFNAHQLVLPGSLAAEVGAFVATLRTALTRSIYPNLRPQPSSEQRASLQAALDRLAVGIPALRSRLGDGYRSLGEPPAAPGGGAN